MDNQRKWKDCVSDSRKHGNIVFVVFRYFFIFTMFFLLLFSFFMHYFRDRFLERLPLLVLSNLHSLHFLWSFLILGFTIDLFSKVVGLPVCVIVAFVSNHWKVFLILKFLISQRVLGVPLSRNVFANNYW